MLDRETALAADDVFLLPWHATGKLPPLESRRIDRVIEINMELAHHLAVVRHERAATIALNESLGAPSPRALTALFAAIDAEPREIAVKA